MSSSRELGVEGSRVPTAKTVQEWFLEQLTALAVERSEFELSFFRQVPTA